MNVKNCHQSRAIYIEDWNIADIEDFAMCNLELLTQLLNKCDELDGISARNLSHCLSANVELLSASRIAGSTKERKL